uniref:Antimicrobial peptide type 1 Id n=1 Tax=Pandalus japonicus TaxID=666362 RepID=T1W2Z9_PANJP|nr:antimicrobial peptide type 1 precursor Id [Pandalus japonicus]
MMKPTTTTTTTTVLMLLVGLIACASSLTIIPGQPGDSCTQYCEEGGFGNYICCDDHPGRCPAFRPVCLGLPVQSCEHDGHCAVYEKCCADFCHPGSQRICKRKE